MSDGRIETPLYPLLEQLLAAVGRRLQGIYTIRDAAAIFGVTPRTIQERCRAGKLPSRDLPGRGRFLSEDLEAFLRNSVRKAEFQREE
ncbi:MAG: helix-turn-helix domain-containing protein [Terriglobia bacterium]